MLYLLFLFSRSMLSNLGYKIVLQSPRFPTLEASDIVILCIDAVHLKGEGSRFDLWAFGGMSPTECRTWLFLIKIHELRESLLYKSVAHFFQPVLWVMSRHLLRIGPWPRTHSCPMPPQQLAEFSFCFHLASETLQWAHHSCLLWVWLWTLVRPFLIGFWVYLSLPSPHAEDGNHALHNSRSFWFLCLSSQCAALLPVHHAGPPESYRTLIIATPSHRASSKCPCPATHLYHRRFCVLDLWLYLISRLGV